MVYTTWSPNFAPLQSKFTKFTNKSHSKMINVLRNIAASKTMVCKWEFDIKHTHNCISIKDDPSYPQWKKKVSHISLKMFIHSHWRQATECGHTWYCWDHRHFIWLYVYHILIQELFMKYGCSICYQVIKKSNENAKPSQNFKKFENFCLEHFKHNLTDYPQIRNCGWDMCSPLHTRNKTIIKPCTKEKKADPIGRKGHNIDFMGYTRNFKKWIV